MLVRAYLRASAQDRDARRAKADLENFATERGLKIAATYIENPPDAAGPRWLSSPSRG